MLFLYDLPNWLMGVIVVGTIIALTYGCYFMLHRFWQPAFTDENRNLAVAVLAIVATINSLLLAFSAVSVWESFGSADAAVVEEANTIGALARDLAVFDSPASYKAREGLHEYTEMVMSLEWDSMRQGVASEDVWRTFDHMFATVAALEPDTPRRVALMPEIWERVNELLKQRRTRLYTSESEVPGTLWQVVLIGTFLTIAGTFVLAPTRFNLAMIGFVSLSVGLVFFLIIALDRPFAGKESIKATPFQTALDRIHWWDAEIRHVPTK